ncbi:hypothetical protein NDU88_002348 [Pleurodeles waltl]|uniref:Uncharacterized protein n=1 Tax=Pleurodeles waltl TaxID=8319 RepID=A0AAV7W3S7_PLEWA|nr:hypothetical protein NDU88_002348 [Pleurodeles waltl]
MEERGVAEETGETEAKQSTAATSVVAAAQREMAAAPVKTATTKEAATAPDAGATTTPGGAAQEGALGAGGQTVRVQPCLADAETRKWCPMTVVSSPLQPSNGQEAENPGIRPHSGESVASTGNRGLFSYQNVIIDCHSTERTNIEEKEKDKRVSTVFSL